MWKDVVVSNIRHPGIFLEGLRKTINVSVTIVGVPEAIRTGNISNTNQN
jgi:hypothetical protein